MKHIGHYWNGWLKQSMLTNPYSKFRSYEFTEDDSFRSFILASLARTIFDYHSVMHHGRDLMTQLGFSLTAGTLQIDQRPNVIEQNRTRKGNFMEILASEFAIERLGYVLPILRLHFNPNPDQSMKGDDILAFKFADHHNANRVLVGESKFKGDHNVTGTVEEGYSALARESRPYPLSILFVEMILRTQGKLEFADKVKQVGAQLSSKGPQSELDYLLVVGSVGKHKDAFASIERKPSVLKNLIALNVVFQPGIDEFINALFEQQIEG